MNKQSIKQTENIINSNIETYGKQNILKSIEAETLSYPCKSTTEFENYKKGYNDVITFIKNGNMKWQTTTDTKTWTDYQEGVVTAVNRTYID